MSVDTSTAAETANKDGETWIIDTVEDWRHLANAVGVQVADKGSLPLGQILGATADKSVSFRIGKWRPAQVSTPQSEVHWSFKAPSTGEYAGGENVFRMPMDEVRKLANIPADKRGRVSRDHIREAIAVHFKMAESDYVILLANKGEPETSTDSDNGDQPAKRKPGRPRKAKDETGE